MKLRYPIKFYATLLLAAAVVTAIGWRLWFNHVCESLVSRKNRDELKIK